jgi:pimeloyl-ACP methyl ester carboxylesterase
VRGGQAGGAPVDLVGHDWGAVITYALCSAHPELVRRAVTMAVPHPRTFLAQARKRPRQLAASWYMGFFQIPGSERIVAARHFALVDRLWRKWSPSLTVSAEQRASLRDCLAASWPAPLEYYRDMRRNAKRDLPALRAPIDVPLLYLHGADDACVLPPTVDDRERFANEYERVVIDGLGHFMHVEDPSGMCARIDEWFARPVRDAASA